MHNILYTCILVYGIALRMAHEAATFAPGIWNQTDSLTFSLLEPTTENRQPFMENREIL